MTNFGWDYPPGVTGNEWQIAGPDEFECPECDEICTGVSGEFKCSACGHEFNVNEQDEPDPDELYERMVDRHLEGD